MTRRDRLGKGLGALLGEYMDPEVEASEISKLPVTVIVPNPVQPRRVFTEEELSDLAGSIRENGLLQPLVVRPAPGSSDRFELIAGERRLRAVTGLGWEKVPVVVRDASDDTLLVLALVENLQRSALNPTGGGRGVCRVGRSVRDVPSGNCDGGRERSFHCRQLSPASEAPAFGTEARGEWFVEHGARSGALVRC